MDSSTSRARKTVRLGELGRIVTGKTPSTRVPENFGEDVPFVTPSDMDSRKAIRETERYLSRLGVRTVKNAMLPVGAVMVSCIGSDMGKAAIASRECVTNQQINSIIVSDKWCAEYVYYNLSVRKTELQTLASSGSAQPILNKGHFSQVPMVMPPLNEQRAVASILSSLDDKIELNRRMNGTLEEVARAFFKSWFVDFDPVRAKMEGRKPFGMDFDPADLFPDSFEDSTLGEVPKGWEIKSIGEVVKAVGGGTPSTKEPTLWEGGTHCWATPKDLSKLSDPILLDTERKITDAGLAKVSSGLLSPGTLLMSSRAPVGYLAISHVPVAVNQGFIAMVCDGPLANYYVLHWARANMERIKGRAGGTTFQEISKKSFRPLPVLVPSRAVTSVFEERVAPLYDKMRANLQQSHTLAAIRDTLLPKLLSGEVRVDEARMLVKEEV